MSSRESSESTGRRRHRRRFAATWFVLGFLFFAALLVGIYLLAPVIQGGSIAPPRPAIPTAELTERRIEILDRRAAQKIEHVRGFVERMRARQEQDPDATMDFLILSGGGANGAFGAGFLIGWSTVPPGPDALPTFDGISGVSTGAFIAPFAYLGTEEARRKIDDFFRNPSAEWVTLREPLSVYPDNQSLMDISGLERDLERIFNVEFARRIDEATTEGRLLLVQASNIDEQIPGVFDLTEAARRSIPAGDTERLRDMVLASSAIPAAFPPREIDGNLYVDGGVIANFYAGDWTLAARNTFGGLWKRTYPEHPIPKTRFWVILNGNLSKAPSISQPTWPSVADRSLDLLYSNAELTTLRHLFSMAELNRLRGDGEVEVRWVSVDLDLPPLNPLHLFDADAMRTLSDYGKRLGADPGAWKTVSP